MTDAPSDDVGETPAPAGNDDGDEPLDGAGGTAALIGLLVYVSLLGVGVVAELLDIDWILAWPIY